MDCTDRRSGRDRRKMPRRTADRNKLQRLQKLIEASSALATVESVEDLLPKLLQMAQEVTFSQASSIMLYVPERDVLEFSLALNESRDGILETLKKSIELKMGEGIAGWVAAHRKPVRVDDAASDERFFRKADKKTGFTTKAVLCAPICHENDLLGVVQVLNPKERPVFNAEDLELLESFAHLASVALYRGRLLEARIREERIGAQLEAASEIQKNFLPDEAVDEDTFRIWGNSRPAIFVGGDLYAYFPLDDGSYIVALADVSGKGLPAALVMSALAARIYSVSTTKPSVSGLLQTLNNDMLRLLGGKMFATLVAAKFDPQTFTSEIGLAGHLPPLRFQAGEVEEIGGIKGMPLGIVEDQTYDTMSVGLEAGQSLVFISDGVTEARNARGEFFEMEGVRMFATGQNTGARAPGLIKAVDSFRAGMDANDDTTVVEIYRKSL